MHRREIFKRLVGLGAAGVVGVPVAKGAEPAPIRNTYNSALDHFNSLFHGYTDGERVGNHSVFFTGLKQHQTRGGLAGQWMAWPGSWLSLADRKKLLYLYSAVPGEYASSYRPGDEFLVGTGIVDGQFLYDEEILRIVSLVIDGKRRLAKVMHEEGADIAGFRTPILSDYTKRL